MNYEFKLPDIGEGVAEGEILKWLVSEGEFVKEDQPIVEVMTDKVNVEIPSPKSGKIAKVVTRVGEVVKVGQTIVVFEIEGEAQGVTQTAPSTAHQVISQPQTTDAPREVLATPATRKLAKELGVEIEKLKGSGPEGRVTSDDVERAAPRGSASTNPTLAASTRTAVGSDERVPLKGIRKTIAERMSKSAHTAAQVTHVDEADVTQLVQLRNQIRTTWGEAKNPKLTFLPLFIKAVIPALKEFPYVNALFEDGTQEIILKKYYNIGIATDTEQGLVVPVIRDADRKGILEIASEIEDLAARARAGKLALEDVRDSTFTLTSVGSIGGLFSTPLVNYPEVAILGIQRMIKRPVVRNDSIVIRDMMNLSLSFDHRVIDGAYAARFLNRVIQMIESPSDVK
jgi:2-oxoglutarate dehydrogenase complex dihydrolipoamide succinyltransferase (E2) component